MNKKDTEIVIGIAGFLSVLGFIGIVAYKFMKIGEKAMEEEKYDKTTGEAGVKGFTIKFEGTKYQIMETDALMTVYDFIVGILKKDPKEVGIVEIIDGPGTMTLLMEEPLDLYAMSKNEGPEYATILLEHDKQDVLFHAAGVKKTKTDKKEEKVYDVLIIRASDNHMDNIEFEFDGRKFLTCITKCKVSYFIETFLGLDPYIYTLKESDGQLGPGNTITIEDVSKGMFEVVKYETPLKVEPGKDHGWKIKINGKSYRFKSPSVTALTMKNAVKVSEDGCLWMRSDEQDVLFHNSQIINLAVYKGAEFYTGACQNGADMPRTITSEVSNVHRGKKAETRIIYVNDESISWSAGKITGLQLKNLIPKVAGNEDKYTVYRLFKKKKPEPILDEETIVLWKKLKWRFEVIELEK